MKILIAMDPAAASHAALEETAARPWSPDSLFEVISVIEPSHLWTTSEVAQQSARRADELVRAAIEQLQSKGHQANGGALTGDPKTIILDRAKSMGANFYYRRLRAQAIFRWQRGRDRAALRSVLCRDCACQKAHSQVGKLESALSRRWLRAFGNRR